MSSNGISPLYVFDSALDEFRPATMEEIDAATNVMTYAQDAVHYHGVIGRIFRDRCEPDKVMSYCLGARPDLVETNPLPGGEQR